MPEDIKIKYWVASRRTSCSSKIIQPIQVPSSGNGRGIINSNIILSMSSGGIDEASVRSGWTVGSISATSPPLPGLGVSIQARQRGQRKTLTYRTIFTGGSDCLVRIHKAYEPDSEPGFHDNHEDAVTSLTCEVCPSWDYETKGIQLMA